MRQFVLHSADRIAAGAIDAARVQHKRPFLAVSADAVKLIGLYSPADNRPEGAAQRAGRSGRGGRSGDPAAGSFRRRGQSHGQAWKKTSRSTALREYRRVLDRYLPADSAGYAAAVGYRPLAERLKKGTDLERKLTVRDETPRASRPPPLPAAERGRRR